MLLAPHPSYTSPPQQAARSSSHSVPALTGVNASAATYCPSDQNKPSWGRAGDAGRLQGAGRQGCICTLPRRRTAAGTPRGKSRSGCGITAALSRLGLTVGCAGRAPCRWAAVTNGRPRGRRRAGRRRTSAAAALRSGGERLRLSQARAGAGHSVL